MNLLCTEAISVVQFANPDQCLHLNCKDVASSASSQGTVDGKEVTDLTQAVAGGMRVRSTAVQLRHLPGTSRASSPQHCTDSPIHSSWGGDHTLVGPATAGPAHPS